MIYKLKGIIASLNFPAQTQRSESKENIQIRLEKNTDALIMAVEALSKQLFTASKIDSLPTEGNLSSSSIPTTALPSNHPTQANKEIYIDTQPPSTTRTTNASKKKRNRKNKHQNPSESERITNGAGQASQVSPGENPPSNIGVSVILGDSIVKGIHGPPLGKKVGHRVVVKPFPGATTDDMRSYMKPTLDKSPDRIVIHVGTHDLRSKEPSEVADGIVDLARSFESQSSAEVIISELVTRRDSLTKVVEEVNKKLRCFCSQHSWKSIRHNNITQVDLNKGGLHLNYTGNDKLFNNFVDALAGSV